tara:strand:+ start:84 stop:425 length:342 start_codon:yes stop_codon:yes gene_type:complete
MKVIIKIEKYISEKNCVKVKMTRLHSHKSIDDVVSKNISCDGLNMDDCELFVDSLIDKISHFIQIQDDSQPILDQNKSEKITGKLDINKLVGKVIEGRISKSLRPIKMRRLEL